jgi:Zn-dependent protease
MGSSIRLGKVLGIPVGVHYSWFFVLLLLTFLLSDQFGDGYQGWIAAIATTILFFLSILAHELCHSIIAVLRDLPVKGITLFIFGGMSQIAREANCPSTEFMVAIVGPLCSLLLGFSFWGLYFALRPVSHTLGDMAYVLAYANIALAIFNILPGFPLDGGRVLRALLWWTTKSYWTATRIASVLGEGVAIIFIAFGVAIFVVDRSVQGMWMIVVGTFLFSIALSNYREMRHRENLQKHTILELLNSSYKSLAPNLTLGQVLDLYGDPSTYIAMLVSDEGRLTGLLTSQSLDSIPRSRWSTTSVQSVATPVNQIFTVLPDDDALKVLELMEEKNLTEVLIVRNGALIGCVRRKTIDAFSRSQNPLVR